MSLAFAKLNLKRPKQIVVLSSPDTLEPFPDVNVDRMKANACCRRGSHQRRPA